MRENQANPVSRPTTAAFALCALLVCVLCACALADVPKRGPDSPALRYWFRTDRPLPADSVSMDPRLRQLSEAFGSGDLPLTRQLAQSLLDDPDLSPDLRAEAAAYLIDSHLAGGDFDAARTTAESLRAISLSTRQELLARVDACARAYNDEITYLQRIIATTNRPEEAAGATLRMARVNAASGRFELAEQSYRQVLHDHPMSPSAGDAVVGLAALYRDRGALESGIAVCEGVIDQAPDSPVALEAAKQVFVICAEAMPPHYDVAAQFMARVVDKHHGTAVAAYANEAAAQAHLQEGLRLSDKRSYLAAAQHLEEALAQRTLGMPGTLIALHTLGLCFAETGQTRRAIPSLERALELAQDARQTFDVGWDLATCHYRLGDYAAGYELFIFLAGLDVAQNLKATAKNMADDCTIQAEAAGRPFAHQP